MTILRMSRRGTPVRRVLAGSALLVSLLNLSAPGAGGQTFQVGSLEHADAEFQLRVSKARGDAYSSYQEELEVLRRKAMRDRDLDLAIAVAAEKKRVFKASGIQDKKRWLRMNGFELRSSGREVTLWEGFSMVGEVPSPGGSVYPSIGALWFEADRERRKNELSATRRLQRALERNERGTERLQPSQREALLNRLPEVEKRVEELQESPPEPWRRSGFPAVAEEADPMEGTVVFSGVAYRVFREGAGWEAARVRCEERGGRLVEVVGAEQLDFLVRHLGTGPGEHLWTGGSAAHDSGAWTWAGGGPVGFSAWAFRQPDNPGGEERRIALDAAGRWLDFTGDEPSVVGYICQWDDPGERAAAAGAGGATAVPSGPASYRDALVLVEGDAGQGSGFLCRIKGKPFVMTNAHVLAGNKDFELRLVDGRVVKPKDVYGAVGYDVVICPVEPEGTFLELMDAVDENAGAGDPVATPGNAFGAQVVREVEGKVVNIGEKLLEVDSKFASGHSGSPIIHRPSGKVVGIATFTSRLDLERLQELLKENPGRPGSPGEEKEEAPKGEDEDALETRWYGYRIDHVEDWQQIRWSTWVRQSEQVESVKELTAALTALLLSGGSFYNRHPEVARVVRELEPEARSFRERKLRELSRSRFRRRATNGVLRLGLPDKALVEAIDQYGRQLAALSAGDVDEIKRHALYDYFAREIDEQRKIRGELVPLLAAHARRMAYEPIDIKVQ